MPRRRYAVFALIGVSTLAVATTAFWRTSDYGRAAGDLARQRAAAKAEGLPTEYADLYRLTPKVRDGDNAFAAYDEAFEAMRESGLGGAKIEALTDALVAGKAKAADLETMRDAFAAADLAFYKAREGSLRPAFAPDRR